MAHVNQIFDHINTHFTKVYKNGVWVKALVTQLAFDETGVLMIEGLDISKFEKDAPEAKIVFRVMPQKIEDIMVHFHHYCNELYSERFVEIPKGELALYFKITPAIHWQGEFMPIVREVGLKDLDAKIENIKTGLKIGVENSILSLPDNNRKPWTEYDDSQLAFYFQKKSFSVNALAVALKRTPLSIIDRLLGKDLINKREGWKQRNIISGRTHVND